MRGLSSESPDGGIGRRAGFRYQCRKTWRFESSSGHHRAFSSAYYKREQATGRAPRGFFVARTFSPVPSPAARPHPRALSGGNGCGDVGCAEGWNGVRRRGDGASLRLPRGFILIFVSVGNKLPTLRWLTETPRAQNRRLRHDRTGTGAGNDGCTMTRRGK